MKKPLYLLICAALILAVAAGCAYQDSAAGESAGTNNSRTDNVGTANAEMDGTKTGNGKTGNGETGNAETYSAETDNGVSNNETGNQGQTESKDNTAVNLEPTAFENVNNFDGVSMTVKEGTVSATGLTLVFNNNTTDHECIYGDYYILEKRIGENWFQVPVAFKGEYGFHAIGYALEPNSQREWPSDWEWLYGSLGPGEYRIVKDILDFRETGNYDTYFLAAEFTLQ